MAMLFFLSDQWLCKRTNIKTTIRPQKSSKSSKNSNSSAPRRPTAQRERNLYEVLGLEAVPPPSIEDCKRAYRKLAPKVHPDKFRHEGAAAVAAATEQFKELNHAYEILKDQQSKDAYDRFNI